MVDIIIKDFPMPPSVNKAFIPVMGKTKIGKNGKKYSGGRIIKSKEYVAYEKKCLEWEMFHARGLASLRKEIADRIEALAKQRRVLTFKVEYYAVFPKDKIHNEDGSLKSLDCDNRIKVAKDSLFRALMIDDKHVFKDEIQKVVSSTSRTYMIIKITEYNPYSEKLVKSVLGIGD